MRTLLVTLAACSSFYIAVAPAQTTTLNGTWEMSCQQRDSVFELRLTQTGTALDGHMTYTGGTGVTNRGDIGKSSGVTGTVRSENVIFFTRRLPAPNSHQIQTFTFTKTSGDHWDGVLFYDQGNGVTSTGQCTIHGRMR